ncbi:MAG: pantetheine-phosphate adenylyltransferase [Alphaproteobacteria bacterium]
MSDTRIGIYPGTFDPITMGHFDIIRRGLTMVDKMIVAVAANDEKGPLYPLGERVAMIEGDIAHLRDEGHEIEVIPFKNLLVDFAFQQNATMIIRGLRAVSDFEYEFQMAGMNARLNRDVETVFLMASDKYQFISSRFVKEIARLGGDVSQFVSPAVNEKLRLSFPKA